MSNNELQEWYILKWDNKYGPFSHVEVIKMLQDKSVFEFDYIWRVGQKNWERIAEVSEFSSEKIKSIFKEIGKNEEAFFRRKHQRRSFHGAIIVHDNERVWKGEAIEISEGGAALLMTNPLLNPGDKVFLHFKPGDGVPPFNAICEIVVKKFTKKISNRDTLIKYGVRFIKVQSQSVDNIKEYIKKAS